MDQILALPRWKMLVLLCTLDYLPSMLVALVLLVILSVAGWPAPEAIAIGSGWTGWLSTGVLTPLIESIIVCGLARFFWLGERSELKGALWAAALFALLHLSNNWVNMLAVFSSFLVQMLVFLRLLGRGVRFWRALGLPVFLHAVHNTLVFLLG